MIDGQQLFAAFAHRALCFEKIFGRGFISDHPISGDVPRPVNGLAPAVRSTDQAATFVRGGFAGMGDDFVKVRFLNGDNHEFPQGSNGDQMREAQEIVVRQAKPYRTSGSGEAALSRGTVLLLSYDLEVQFFQLLWIDFTRGVDHQILS